MIFQKGTPFKIWLVLHVVFALGAGTGAAIDAIYRSRAFAEGPGGRGRGEHKDMFERMRRDLSLSEEQATALQKVLEETRSEFRALRTEVEPRYDQIRQNARVRMRALLNPEQQKIFDAKSAEIDARRKEDEKRKH